MSHPSSPPTPLAAASPAPASPVSWPDAARQAAFEQWLAPLVQSHQLLPASLRPASADASFRRYLRIDSAAGASCIVMDAPPDKENCRPFVQVQALMAAAGLNVPHILAWDEPGGFMLLSDLGSTTLIELLTPEAPQAALGWYLQATDVLLDWQKASKPGVLPAYDEALLRRELALFPDWYLGQHRGITLDGKQQATLARAFDAIVAHNLAAPSVFVHRDFMTRNLMAPTLPAARGSLPPEGALAALGRPGGGSVAPTATAARDIEAEVYQDRYLIRRPLLQALQAPAPGAVLLIDEVDRADEPFEAFLLEYLGEYQVSIPEIGTVRATATPVTILTSNRTRDLHDAVKRRCLYHWLDYPERERELAIVRAHVPGASEALATQVADFVGRPRSQPCANAFQRAPGIAESVEWAKALVALDTIVVDPEVVTDTAGILFKQREDVAALTADMATQLLKPLAAEG